MNENAMKLISVLQWRLSKLSTKYNGIFCRQLWQCYSWQCYMQVSYFNTDLSPTIEEHTKSTRQRQQVLFLFTLQAPMLSHHQRRNRTQHAARASVTFSTLIQLFVLLIKINFRIIISKGHVQWEDRYICCNGTQI